MIDDTLLLDCGDERFLAYNPRAILITHLHPDHAFFMRDTQAISLSVPLYAPESIDWMPSINTSQQRSCIIAGYTITAIPTIHSIKVKSNAYLVEKRGIRILYTGDMIWIEKKYQHLLKNLDLVITEASYMRKG